MAPKMRGAKPAESGCLRRSCPNLRIEGGWRAMRARRGVGSRLRMPTTSAQAFSARQQFHSNGEGHHERQQSRSSKEVSVSLHGGLLAERDCLDRWAQHGSQPDVRLVGSN